MQKPVRYGLIGCGMMGREHIQNIQLIKNTHIAAIFEPDSHMAMAGQALAPDAQLVDSLDALIAMPDLDALVITSPNFEHAKQMQTIAAARTIPILCEKPVITDTQDSDLIISLHRDYRAPVWVAMEYRYMPPIKALIEQANATTGGVKMLTIREHRYPFLKKVGHWNRLNKYSGGTFVEKCCHFFDLMRLILKDEPIRIMASAGQDVNHLNEVYDGVASDIVDNGYVIVDFAGGGRAMLELCMFAEGSRYQEDISAVGAKGRIEAHVPGPTRFWPKALGEPPIPKLIRSYRATPKIEEEELPVPADLLMAGDHNGSTFYQHLGFNAVVRGEKSDVDVSLIDGLRSVKMGIAAQDSARHGVAIDLSFDEME